MESGRLPWQQTAKGKLDKGKCHSLADDVLRCIQSKLINMAIDNIETLAENYEKQELENAASGTAVPASTYTHLLAIYLYQNDLCGAKYLWKRIPAATKSSCKELESVWKVGQKMWLRDFPGIYVALSEPWSAELAEIMENIRVNTRERAAKLVATAYSYITLQALAQVTGLTPEQAMEEALTAGWEVDMDAKLVKPCKPAPPPVQPVSCEEQLSKLTDFVSFLEI